MKYFEQKNLLVFTAKTISISFVLLISSFAFASQASAQLINEIANNPPSTDAPCEYIEIKGTPGATVAANTYYVEVDGDGASAGNANMVVNLSNSVYGANGLITITSSSTIPANTCGTRNYAAAGSAVIIDAQLNNIGIQNGTGTFLIVTSAVAITETDYDANDDGTLDVAPLSTATVIDSISISDGGAADRTYATVLPNGASTFSNGVPDAFSRFNSNTTPNSAAAFYYGDLTGATNDSTVYANAPARNANFPTGGALTPGAVNAGPTAAGAIIAGRIINSGGKGIRNVRLTLLGGSLLEPIQTVSNNSGHYEFPEVPAGETYIVTVNARRYTFNQSSRVINLNENLTDIDFIGEQNGLNTLFR